ncbi:paraquat-inducible protein A [Vibrio coralliilyticus]|uniref:Paraquat-inducible protein A n=1 Tax=Vibrio coralliilyticus TaxID=190893 RepID=A0A837GB22_9VIBR|nr:paraquat-inducible protein A [Vibrio coralliilyticus]KJY71030.1 paraquat-inducible protein A [Vibrio coralliilyticus]QOU30980.1 paraquat-inducible protein A [Vibrio coralliilyticus]
MSPPKLTSHLSEASHVRLCHGCELPIDTVSVERGKSAYCPRCGSKLYRGGTPSLSGNLAIAITCLLLFIPSHFFDFISIRLFGVMIPATLPSGVFTLFEEGFVFLSLLIIFCSSIAPLLVSGSVLAAHAALNQRNFPLLKYSLYTIQHLKNWVMIDVFLVSVAISCFKLQDYSDIYVGVGLYGLVLLQIATVMLVTRVSVRRYWEAYESERSYHFKEKQLHCHHCHLSQPEGTECVRCHKPIYHRKPHSVQVTWAYLVAATIAIFPANLIPISILITNGQRLEDTIFSGVASLVKNGMPGIAVIIFVASIVVPVAKIIGLAYLLLAIQFKRKVFHRQRMIIYFVIKWIGRWSMMDLFVISIMMTLVDRGQILDFTPGYGAVAFGIVVVLTMLAAESIDPRLLWDNYPDASKSKSEKREEPLND